jgi:CheY-like chemotaxis protein
MIGEQGIRQDVLQGQMETATLVTGRLAHDFSNILTGILGFAELSLTQLPPNSPAQRFIEEIIHSAQNGAGWIHKLQAFSRPINPRVLPIPLAPLVAAEQDRLRQAWGNRVTFLVALPDDLPRITFDADSLRQLLGQLLDNAGEAVVERGVVTLSARTVDVTEAACQNLVGNARSGKHVEVTITDSGTGLSPEAKERIFRELFFSTKARRRGLGLAMVYNILHKFQAGLCFDLERAQGVTVRIFLPVAGEPKADNPPVSPDRTGRVLVVDDDPVVLRMACDVLANAGFHVHGAAGPEEAIDQYHAQSFRLIVSDILMPRMNGFEMIRHLQSRDFVVNVLFISSQPSNGLANDVLLDQYPLLKKPFEARELVQATAAALARAPVPCGGQT